MLFSKQKWFCNICGQEQFSEIANTANRYIGAMLCSRECSREFKWRETLSIMGKEYHADPEPYKATK